MATDMVLETVGGKVIVAHVGRLDFTRPTGTSESIRGIASAFAETQIQLLLCPLGKRADTRWAQTWDLSTTSPWTAGRRIRKMADLIHFHGAFRPELAVIARLAGLPYVVSPHGGYSPAIFKKGKTIRKELYYSLWEKKFHGSAASVIALTTGEAADLSARTSAGIHVVPNTYDTATCERSWEMRQACQARQEGLIFLGRADWIGKGLDRVRDISAFLPYLDFRLHLANLSENRGMFQEQLSGCDNMRVMPPAYDEDKATVLASAAAYIQLSRFEAFGMSVVEAAAAGLPLVLSREMYISESAMQAGAAIVLDERASVAENAQRIQRAISDEVMLSRMSQDARRWARENFSPQAVREALKPIYMSCLGYVGNTI